MKDIELIDILFRYLYENGEILYYERVLKESGVSENQINLQLIFKLHGLLKASGFIQELNKMVENHPSGVKLNDSGFNMMMEYGSYGVFLKEKRDKKQQEKNIKKSTIHLNYATLIISIGTFIGGILLSTPIKELWKLFLSIFE